MFAGCQLVLALIIAWWLHSRGYSTAAVVIPVLSLVVFALGMLKPKAAAGLYAAWMLAAFPVGWVMSYVVAGVVYFAVITPIGLVLKVLGRDGLNLRFDPSAESYWTDTSDERPDPKQYFRQF